MLLSMLAAPFIVERSEHHRAQLEPVRLDAPRDGAAQHRGAVDGRRTARGDLRLRAQRPESGAPARAGIASRSSRSTSTRSASARRRRRARAWCSGTPRGAKCWSRRGCCARRRWRSPMPTPRPRLRILAHVQELRPGLPVVVRTLDDTDIDRLKSAGAAEVVAEIMEGSLMLASTALMLLGVPFNRVLRRIRETREQRYSLFRGFFRGMTDEASSEDDAAQPRLHSVIDHARRGGDREDARRARPREPERGSDRGAAAQYPRHRTRARRRGSRKATCWCCWAPRRTWLPPRSS